MDTSIKCIKKMISVVNNLKNKLIIMSDYFAKSD